MGKVRASKLMASKRPDLVPIRDRHLEAILGAPDTWWDPWRQLASRPEIAELVDRVTPAHLVDRVTLLRRLDVILWMEAEYRSDRL